MDKSNGKIIKSVNNIDIGYVVIIIKKRWIMAEHSKKIYFDEYSEALAFANRFKNKTCIKFLSIFDCKNSSHERLI